MPKMHKMRLFVSLVPVTMAFRSNQDQLAMRNEIKVHESVPKCSAAVFNFCSRADLADAGVACISSADALPTTGKAVQCVPKKNNKHGHYKCPPELPFKCDGTPEAITIPLHPPRSPTFDFTAIGTGSPELEFPLYCGLAQMAVNALAYQPLTKDLKVSTILSFMYGLNDYNLSFNEFELGSVTVDECSTKMDAKHVLSVHVSKLSADILSAGWAVQRVRWPHFPESGKIQDGNVGASFDVSLDLIKEEETNLEFSLDAIDMNLNIVGHEWLSEGLAKLTKLSRPVVSKGMEFALGYELNKALEIVRTQGGCALLHDGLALIQSTTLSFETKEPITTHIPLVGNIFTSVNSTSIDLPHSMKCVRAEFDGSAITFHIEDFDFGAAFNWAYRKEDSTFWHNSGTGSVKTKVGLALHTDLVNPDDTSVSINLPDMDFQLTSEYDSWFYSHLSSIVGPFVKLAVNNLGSYFAEYEIKKTLKEKFAPVPAP